MQLEWEGRSVGDQALYNVVKAQPSPLHLFRHRWIANDPCPIDLMDWCHGSIHLPDLSIQVT